MLKLIKKPAQIFAAGNKKKIIREYIGRSNSKTKKLSIAHMKSPAGWIEPGQRPEFAEYTLVLKGTLRVTSQKSFIHVKKGQAVIVPKNEWIQYSSPYRGGAEYIAVCLPAFSPKLVHRDHHQPFTHLRSA